MAEGERESLIGGGRNGGGGSSDGNLRSWNRNYALSQGALRRDTANGILQDSVRCCEVIRGHSCKGAACKSTSTPSTEGPLHAPGAPHDMSWVCNFPQRPSCYCILIFLWTSNSVSSSGHLALDEAAPDFGVQYTVEKPSSWRCASPHFSGYSKLA